MSAFKVACIQMNTGLEMEAEIEKLRPMVRAARARGADFITTPETALMVDRKRTRMLAKAKEEADHPGLPAFADMARETGAWLLAGSLTVKLDAEHVANRSYLFDPKGAIVASYDKIHMFDVDLAGGDSYRESATVRSGARATLAPTPWGLAGLTVCYDLRFPQLYRALAQAGASILTVPACFTRYTGQAHWHVLLRARAIETGCFVIAPAQVGTHADGRETYGHSLVVAPWGEVLADGGEEVGITLAEIDMARVAKARGMVPSLEHDRPFQNPRPVLVSGLVSGRKSA
jgi:predicted amidohydrolase